MVTLPENQDQLLKKLHEIEEEEKAGIWPERAKIVLGLLAVVIILFIIVMTFLVLRQAYSLIPVDSALIFIAFAGLVAGYFNKKPGFCISIVISILASFYATYITSSHYSEFITVLDALAIFIAATGFGKKGFFPVLTIIALKTIVVFALFSGNRYTDFAASIVDLVSHLLNVSLIGYVPVLIQSISAVSRLATKQTIRAEILSLQNQELLQSWGSFYKGNKEQRAENREQ